MEGVTKNVVEDIIIDTNVLVHACKASEAWFASSVQFIERLLEADTKLCIDDMFDVVPSKNKSLIGYEYLKWIPPTTLSYHVLMTLALNKRISVVGRNVSPPLIKLCNKLVPDNKRDRTFLRVAINSIDKVFVSHDFSDFPVAVRKKIKSTLDVKMYDAKSVMTA